MYKMYKLCEHTYKQEIDYKCDNQLKKSKSCTSFYTQWLMYLSKWVIDNLYGYSLVLCLQVQLDLYPENAYRCFSTLKV